MKEDEILLKKWELLWNHYKLQNECIEKRRTFLWIIQVLIFTGWYNLFKDNNNYIIALILSFFGFFISAISIFVLNREARSALISMHSLRDVEFEWNKINNIELNRFILDEELLYKRGEHKFKYKDDKINIPKCREKYSASNILNYVVPIVISGVWLILILLVFLRYIGYCK